jgi:8-oxo-dGTP pyrophosphatase MutT (NUDIX family)
MTPSAEPVRQSLDRLVHDGVTWGSFDRPFAAPARRAAVLVLFGRLDGLDAPGGASTAAPVPSDLDILFIERAASLNHHPGQIAFPGGRIDPGDGGPIGAALREAAEETGLDPSGVDVVGTLRELPVSVSNYIVTPVLGWWARQSLVNVVDAGESAAVFRVPVAELVSPDNRRLAVVRRGIAASRTPAFVIGSRVIWGFTGLVLDRMLDSLGWAEPWEPRTVHVPV